MPFGTDDAVLPASGFGANDAIVGGSVPAPREAQSLMEAVTVGLQSSATGLAIRGKLPEQQLGINAPWYNRIAAGAAGVVADLPLSVVGAAGGAAAGTAVAPGLGTAVGGGAGAFAAPMALREALVDAYSHNYASSWAGVWEIAKSAMLGAGKGAVIGGLTGGAGKLVAPLAAPLGKVAGGTAIFGTELATLTAASSAVEGHMPTAQDFLDNAILLGGMKAAMHVASGLRDIYVQTGKLPSEVLADAQKDPSILASLKGEALPTPDRLPTKTLQSIVDFNRAERPSSTDLVELTKNVSKEGVKTPIEITYSEPDGMALVTDGNNRIAAATAAGVSDVPVKFVRTEVPFTDAQRAKAKPIAELGLTEQQIPPRKPLTAQQVADKAEMQRLLGDTLPPAYRPQALEQRIQAAVGADQRPEAIRQIIGSTEPPKLGEPPISDPVKYEYITDQDTLKGVLRITEQKYQDEIKAQTRGVVTNKETAAAALKLVTSGDVAEHVIGTAEGAAQLYARAHVLKGITQNAYTKIVALKGIPEADMTPRMKLEALAAVEQLSMTLADFRGARAEAGRALQVFQAIKRDSSVMGDAEQIAKLYERKGSLQDIAKLVSALQDPAQMQRFAEGYTKATTLEKVMEAWKAGILSGPQTHLANIMGNVGKWLTEIPESAVAATITAGQRAIKGDPLSMAQYKARALAPLYGVQMGAVDSVKIAAEVWNQRGEHLEKADVYRTAIEGKKGEIIRIPFRALQVEDALFRTIAERSQAHIMAVDRATKEGLHPDTAEFREQVVKYTEHPDFGLSEDAGLAALKKVQDAGAEGVFSQRLGPRMETVQRAMAGHPIQFIVPFFRTPANLVSWAVQHTPGLNFVSGRWRADFEAGGELRARALARVTIGSGLALAAYSMAQNGTLTGGGLFNPEQRRTQAAAGIQPYSIKIGDKYYSYQRMEPIAKVLGLAGDLVELMQATKDPEDKGKIAAMLVLMFGNATVSTTYLSGLSNAMQSVLDPTRYGKNFLEQYATSVVPKIVGQTAATIDPDKREVDGILDAIQSQIPYYREKLMPKRDVWGEPVQNNKWFEVMPVQMTTVSEDKVKTEAVRLQLAIQDAPKNIVERGPFNPKDKQIELSSEQRDIFRQVAGKNAMAILSPIVNAPDWSHIPDFAKAEIYKKVIEGTRKQGQYAALPPDDAARAKVREKIVNEIIKQSLDADTKAPAPEKRIVK